MKQSDITKKREVRELIRRALNEDIGAGDVTSKAVVGPKARAKANLIARRNYTLAGIRVAEAVFKAVDPKLTIRLMRKDGHVIAPGQTVMSVSGNARSILAAERTALNFLQRMTGIASHTAQFVKKAARYGVQILDTRKTTPGMRLLEKYAVLCGGGANHRMGLYDRILIKDNHRAFWRQNQRAGLAEAVRQCRKRFPGLVIEVEVENERELRDVLKATPDWVLLDNMPASRIRRCVKLAHGKCKMEASGGITLRNLPQILGTGIDAVSIGALTHSVTAADFSLEFE